MHTAKTAFNDPSRGNVWFIDIRPHGLDVVTAWGKETLQLGEAILVGVIQTDPLLLGTAPDVIFTMLCFAAGLVIGVKMLMVDKLGTELLGASDKLLTKVLGHLNAASLSPDHAVTRCAQLIRVMVAAWDKRQHIGAYTTSQGPIPNYSTSPSNEALPPHNAAGQNWMSDQDMFHDADFWTHFFGGLEAGVSIY